jgi:hypothetical protein
MKIGFDIGGVISKYPSQFGNIIGSFDYHKSWSSGHEITEIYIITDMHPKEKVWETIVQNGFHYSIHPDNVYCADYEKYGNMAKAVLISELALDIFIDDFDGYLQWDSSLGPQPLLLKVMPDAYKPYWSDDWKCDGGEFGRRKYHHE